MLPFKANHFIVGAHGPQDKIVKERSDETDCSSNETVRSLVLFLQEIQESGQVGTIRPQELIIVKRTCLHEGRMASSVVKVIQSPTIDTPLNPARDASVNVLANSCLCRSEKQEIMIWLVMFLLVPILHGLSRWYQSIKVITYQRDPVPIGLVSKRYIYGQVACRLRAEMQKAVRASRPGHVVLQPACSHGFEKREHLEQVGFAGSVGPNDDIDPPQFQFPHGFDALESCDGQPIEMLPVVRGAGLRHRLPGMRGGVRDRPCSVRAEARFRGRSRSSGIDTVGPVSASSYG